MSASRITVLCAPAVTVVAVPPQAAFLHPRSSALARLWRVHLRLPAFGGFICACPPLAGSSALARLWRVHLRLPASGGFICACPPLAGSSALARLWRVHLRLPAFGGSICGSALAVAALLSPNHPRTSPRPCGIILSWGQRSSGGRNGGRPSHWVSLLAFAGKLDAIGPDGRARRRDAPLSAAIW